MTDLHAHLASLVGAELAECVEVYEVVGFCVRLKGQHRPDGSSIQKTITTDKANSEVRFDIVAPILADWVKENVG